LTEFGQKMFVDTRDNSLAPHLLVDGYWEPWIGAAMAPLLRGAIFIDVGANFGWYSLLAQHHGAAHVWAFEPNPRLLLLLRRTCGINGYRWATCGYAVSDEFGKAGFWFDPNFMGGGTICRNEGGKQHEVHVVTLDDTLKGGDAFAGHLAGQPVVLKIDVEGAEAKAILGAKKLLQSQNCTVFFEKNDDPSGTLRVREMYEFMEAQSYQLAQVCQDSKIRAISREDALRLPDASMLCFCRFGS
jgi:FkbM family methyltransferase